VRGSGGKAKGLKDKGKRRRKRKILISSVFYNLIIIWHHQLEDRFIQYFISFQVGEIKPEEVSRFFVKDYFAR
jgi:hypothetical protein